MAEIKNQIKSGIDAAVDQGKNVTDKAATAATGTKQDAHGLTERVKEGANDLIETAGKAAGQAREKVAEWAGEAGIAAKQAGHKVHEWAGEAYDATADQVGDFGKELTTLIRKHPLPSLLIGFGIGLLVGRTARMI